ncbi:MAG: TolC family protein, partial [Bdellovibrionota bacterium]
QADAAVEMAHNHLPVDLALWRRRLVYSTALFEARKTDVSKSEESVRLAKEGLHAGTRTTSEVLDAELDLFRSKAGVIRAQLDALEATVNLELALGRKS